MYHKISQIKLSNCDLHTEQLSLDWNLGCQIQYSQLTWRLCSIMNAFWNLKGADFPCTPTPQMNPLS